MGEPTYFVLVSLLDGPLHGYAIIQRSGELSGGRVRLALDTLLAASPPGRRWPSLRDARSLVIGGLRVRGLLAWCLSILWAGLGAAGAGYDFILSEHVPQAQYIGIPQWVGESRAIYLAAGTALMFPIANWQPLAPAVWACSKNQGCALAGYRYAVVTWADLALFAAWLAVGAAMTLMLALTGRRRVRLVPDGTVTGASA